MAAVALACLALVSVAAPAAAKPAHAGGDSKGGKPGYPDRISFGGYSWQVKSSNSPVGPGPNVFSTENVSVDSQGLHLQIAHRNGTWTAAEVIGDTSLGYGTYTFTVASAVNSLDPQVVLGMFTWSDKARFNHREVDIEVARWGNPSDPSNAQFVVQPWDAAGNLSRFNVSTENPTTYSFTWTPGRIHFEASTGATFTVTGDEVPPAGGETPRINLWLFEGNPPQDGQPVEVVLSNFRFEPAA